MSKLLFGIQGSGPRTRDDRLRGRLTPKLWKQKRRLSKLFENMNSIVYISYPLFVVKTPGSELGQKADPQHWSQVAVLYSSLSHSVSTTL